MYLDLNELAEAYKEDFVYCDAMKSPLTRLQNRYRYQILIRLKQENFKPILDKIYDICDKHENQKVSFFVEINPQSLS